MKSWSRLIFNMLALMLLLESKSESAEPGLIGEQKSESGSSNKLSDFLSFFNPT